MEIEIGKKLKLSDEYLQSVRARSFWQAAYDSTHHFAEGYDAAGLPILPKYEKEREPDYIFRRATAISRPFTRAVIGAYHNRVARAPIVRQVGDNQYQEFVEDCDGLGTPLTQFMHRALRKSQIRGKEFILCDSTIDPNVQVTTKADEIALGARTVLVEIDADSVLEYKLYRGIVQNAVLLMEDPTGVKFLLVVTPLVTQRVELDQKTLETASPELVPTIAKDPVRHNYGACPLIKLEPLESYSQSGAVAESQKRICGLESMEFLEYAHATFTTWAFMGVSPEQLAQIQEVGAGIAIAIPTGVGSNSIPTLEKLGADPAQSESLRKAYDKEVKELYRGAGLSPGNPTDSSTPESGIAKSFRTDEVNAILSAISACGGEAENRATKLLAKAGAFAFPGKARWPEEFNTPSLIQELEAVLRVWESNLPDTLRRDAARRFMSARRPLLSPEETAKLEEELEEVPVNRAAVDDEVDPDDPDDPDDNKDDEEDDKAKPARKTRKPRNKKSPKTGTIGIRSFSDGSQHQPE
jgi:hypothetical protein